MREVWGYRVCLVLCSCGLVKGTYVQAWAKEHTSIAFAALSEEER